MREHLFRGQRDDGKWFYGDLIQYDVRPSERNESCDGI